MTSKSVKLYHIYIYVYILYRDFENIYIIR